MQIPLYNAQVQAQPDPGSARGDVRAAGQGGAALAQAADLAGGEIARFALAQENARRAAVLTAATGSATRALQDATVEAESDTDYASLPDRFKKRLDGIRDQHLKAIEDPVVAGMFSRDWQRLTLPQELAVRRDARKREIDAMGATLDDTLQTFVPLAAAARTPEEQQSVLDQARIEIARNAELGIIGRQDAVKRERGFVGRVDEARILARLNDARRAGDPDIADRAMTDLMAGKFAGLDEVAKERMIRTAQSERDAIRRDLVQRQEKIERDAEKTLRDAQTRAEADFMVRMDKDPAGVRPIDLQDALKRQQITNEGFRMLTQRLDANRQGTDVPAVEGDLRARMIRDGADIYDEIVAKRNAGQLSQRTADALIKDNQDAIQARAKEPWKSAEQKRGHEFVTRFLGGDQPMITLTDTQTQRLALAQRDYARLVLAGGMDPDAAARQVTAKYVDEIKVGLRSDYFGEADIKTGAGIAKASARLRDLQRAGLIDPAALDAEIGKLEEARRLLSLPGAAPAAAPNQKAKP